MVACVGKFCSTYTRFIRQQSLFNGSAWTIPGIVEAIGFDYGGRGVAYIDIEYNEWVKHPTLERVNLEECQDGGGGLNVTKLLPGEWLECTVFIRNTGFYNL